jgi:hypothetical protein
VDERVADEPWYSVRCLIRLGQRSNASNSMYEERVTIWRATDFEDAIARAEREASEYANATDAEYVGLAQAFHLACGDVIDAGTEVFSLIRGSELEPEDYINRFFDTDAEHQGMTD